MSPFTDLQIHVRGGSEDTYNSKIIFLFLNENLCCDPSLELSQWDGSTERSQNVFVWRNMAHYPKIIPVTLSYLEHCIYQFEDVWFTLKMFNLGLYPDQLLFTLIFKFEGSFCSTNLT